jgi:hypothetical protein
MSPLTLQLLALVLGFVLWAGLVYLKFTPAEPLIALLQMGIGGLITHMLKALGERSASANPQAGFASVRIMIMVASIALGLSLLSGCASLTNAGHVAYTVEMNPTGCSVTVADGKEYKNRNIVLDCHKAQFAVTEEESKAFKGQALAVKGLTILPSLGLQDILAPRDK